METKPITTNKLHSNYLSKLESYYKEWKCAESAIRKEINTKRRKLTVISRERKAWYDTWQRERSKSARIGYEDKLSYMDNGTARVD